MASKGVNKVIIVGNLGRDPEIRYMKNGNAVANFSVATSESWKDQQGQKQEKTEWHNIVMYSRLAEIAGEYLKKGAKVYLEGKLQTSKWQDQNTGQDRYKTEVVANEMQMLDGRNGGDSGQQQAQRPSQQQPQQQGYLQQQQQQGYAPQPQHPPLSRPSGQQQGMPIPQGDGWDDDIPF